MTNCNPFLNARCKRAVKTGEHEKKMGCFRMSQHAAFALLVILAMCACAALLAHARDQDRFNTYGDSAMTQAQIERLRGWSLEELETRERLLTNRRKFLKERMGKGFMRNGKRYRRRNEVIVILRKGKKKKPRKIRRANQRDSEMEEELLHIYNVKFCRKSENKDVELCKRIV